MSAKHSCKNTEYETFDFGASGPNRTPTQKGEDEHERNMKKTGPQRRRENDHEKNTKK
jgi:hypothetical protein